MLAESLPFGLAELRDQFGRVALGELDVDVSAVIGNHPEPATVTRAHGIPFHHVPFPAGDPDEKAAADEVELAG